MISYIKQEDIVLNWPTLAEALGKFWDTTLNLETLDNLKRRLLAESCQLWLWTDPEYGRFLFVTESCQTATAKVLVVTHTAGFNMTGERWGRKKIEAAITKIFEEVEDLALMTYHDAVKIHARPAHVKLAKGYTEMATPIFKRLT